MTRFTRPRIALVSAVLASIAGVVGGAQARAPHTPTPFADVTVRGAGSTTAAGAATASNGHRRPNPAFAGYVTDRTGAASVKTRFRIPAFTCSQQERAVSPGVFLLSGPADHEWFNAANVILGCFKGRPLTEEALVVDNAEKDSFKPLHAGDTVLAQVIDHPTGAITVRLSDLTQGHRFTLHRTARGVAAQAQLVGDWASIDVSTGRPVVPPRFAPTTFQASRVQGKPLGSLKPTGYDMTRSRHRLIAASRLAGSPRDSFTCYRRIRPARLPR